MNKSFAGTVLAVFFSMGVPQYASGQIYAGEGGASETSALGSMLSGALVIGLPIIASMSLADGEVGEVRPAGDKNTDVEIKSKSIGKPVVVRVPDLALQGKAVKPGQKAELIADANGHVLRIEDKPVVYVPGKAADGLMHSKPVM